MEIRWLAFSERFQLASERSKERHKFIKSVFDCRRTIPIASGAFQTVAMQLLGALSAFRPPRFSVGCIMAEALGKRPLLRSQGPRMHVEMLLRFLGPLPQEKIDELIDEYPAGGRQCPFCSHVCLAPLVLQVRLQLEPGHFSRTNLQPLRMARWKGQCTTFEII